MVPGLDDSAQLPCRGIASLAIVRPDPRRPGARVFGSIAVAASFWHIAGVLCLAQPSSLVNWIRHGSSAMGRLRGGRRAWFIRVANSVCGHVLVRHEPV